MRRAIYIATLLLLTATGCKKPYNPPAVSSPETYLIVEGVINAGPDSTKIKLSYTVPLSGANTTNPVLNAVVSVVSNQGTTYPLAAAANGYYVAPGLNLNSANTYRLSIKTANSEQYYSDYEPVTVTPPIDSVGFTIQSNGIQEYVSSHDAANTVKYYRWDYGETWQFHSEYESIYISDGKEIVARTPAQNIYSCFGNDTSSNIILGSSAALSQDVISQQPITQITSTSEKLETKYSIEVNQYALTGEAYSFWENLKTNTEQLGSIFDAQPSQINGNIHCQTNSAETVVGYISVSTVQHKRIFINNTQLPKSAQWNTVYPYTCTLYTALFCRPVSTPCRNDVALFLIPLSYYNELPISALTSTGNGPPTTLGYLGSDRECVDCTLRGTTMQPPFWK